MSKDKKAPPVIYLQDEDDENHPESGEWYEGTTWCEDAINDGDVKYIRADIAERYRAALDKARADLIGAVQRNDLDVNAMLRRINEALHPTQPAEGRER